MKNLMKIKTLAIVIALQFIAIFAISQTAKFNYQAVVRDNLGNPLVNTMVDIDVRILQGAVDGTEVFAEYHATETNGFGLVTLEIGSIEDLSVVDWSADTYFFEVSVDGELMGTSQLLSVPMAVSATYAENYDESDPYFVTSPAGMITDNEINNWNEAHQWGDHAGLYLPADYTPELEETDPIYNGAPASTIAYVDLGHWNEAYLWGDHNGLYLPSDYSETDPVYSMAPASTIANTDIVNWNEAYLWGDHDGLYLPVDYSETDPVYTMAPASAITNDDINDWSTAYSWGDHNGLYLPSDYSETDPVYSMAPASTIANTDIVNWNEAYLWGDHDGLYLPVDYSETDPVYTMAPASAITNDNINDWSTAYSWGDHSGLYLPSDYSPDYSNLVNLTDDQDINGAKTFTGTVEVPIPVNEYDAVPKAYVDELLARIEDLEVETGLKVKDIDGNLYNVVTIGTQVWMQENLKVENYNDGSPISHVNIDFQWNIQSVGAYTQASHNPDYKEVYGNLYNWHAVNTGNLCPVGWHVPSHIEWTELETYLIDNGYGYEGSGTDVAKSLSATEMWNSSSVPGDVGNDLPSNNTTGFTALPGSFMRGMVDIPGNEVYFWTSDEYSTSLARYRGWTKDASDIHSSGITDKTRGFSVRCLKD